MKRQLVRALSMLELADIGGRANLLDDLEFCMDGCQSALSEGNESEASGALNLVAMEMAETSAERVFNMCKEKPREVGLLSDLIIMKYKTKN